MKLFVQIPCLNEEVTLSTVIESIPREIAGIDSVEILIIDDGCTDNTVQMAERLGVKHFIRHRRNRGLAKSFQAGIDYCLAHGADIIVNTDGDNQYPQERIPDLVYPILEGKADVVIADRQTQTIAHFSPLKKILQRFGSWVVNKAAGTNVSDAVSGFRAYSREAALNLNVVSEFSYCTETVIQAGQKRLCILSVPVITNAKTRESRLFSSIWQHVFNSMMTIVRIYLMYKPFRIFVSFGLFVGILGLVPFLRYITLLAFFQESVGSHLQSLIAGTVLVIMGILFIAIGFLGELLAINRKLQEDSLYRLKCFQFGKNS